MADHWGKIGCHFPAKANPNADVWNIEFLPKGGSSTSVIDRVYMVPDGANITSITDLQHYIVWTTDVTLVPESDAVCIEFVPPYDIPLSNVAIFCNSSESSTSVNFAVYHESGLVVAKNDGDTVTQNVEKFGMTGQRRVTAVSGVTLKKGLKYYIQYTNVNNTFKPVVMEDWVGNYKIFSHGQIQNKHVADINNAHDWLGTIDTTMGIFTMKPGDFFMWQSSGWTPGMNNGTIYMRSNVGANTPFAGVVGNPATPTTITTADITNLINKPNGAAFMWYVNNYPNMANGSIWKKTHALPSNTIDFTGDDAGPGEMGHLFSVLYQTNNDPVLSVGGTFMWNIPIGSTFSVKSPYVNMVASSTPISEPPSDPVEYGIYYTNQYGWLHCACWDYVNGEWTWVTDNGTIKNNCINIVELPDQLDYIGVNSDLTNSGWDTQYQSDGLRNATVYTDKKHYLEINGTEV